MTGDPSSEELHVTCKVDAEDSVRRHSTRDVQRAGTSGHTKKCSGKARAVHRRATNTGIPVFFGRGARIIVVIFVRFFNIAFGLGMQVRGKHGVHQSLCVRVCVCACVRVCGVRCVYVCARMLF